MSDRALLTKFESKSHRVKGLSFHPVRPWVLASLHNGVIQLWDYSMNTIIDKFEQHEGPVRGVHFHPVQPLIVSGGDDYKVNVWDYKLRRCLFTLLGHLDYVRTVQFHSENPWIVSASDDQSIRIWNWMSRSCISILTGHNHYVMCASFHPTEDMLVSASLDQTVRVWDTTSLRQKTVRGRPQHGDDTVVSRVNNELFGGDDALVKYVLEGHERGVNWASFHPTLPLVISGADDRQIKLWRMNETKAWEVDTMRGHTNNVSCVLFHPKHELVVSNSEDRTIRVWDVSKRIGVQTFRRESDRFWILAAHPDQNLLAAGHDSGMTIFKLERERPAFETVGGRCFYVKDRYLRIHEFGNGRDISLASLRRTSYNMTPGIGGGPRTLHFNVFNKAEINVLLHTDSDGGSFELFTFANDSNGSGEAPDIKRGTEALAAVFIARDRFIVLDKSRQLLVMNFNNEVVKKITPPLVGADAIFATGTLGRILLKSDDRVVLYDQQARKVVSEMQAPKVKYICWNKDYSMVALMSKHQVIIANKNLEQQCVINEPIRIKGGAWDGNKPIFVYATLKHVKYLISNGDSGIVRGLEFPVYVTKINGNSLFCLDREGKMRTLEVDITEAMFKLALERKDYPEVMRMVKHSRLCGKAIIAYLTEKGYPEVALHFVQDNKTRFDLALACGNIHVAMDVAYDLGDDAWRQLGIEALRQGNHEVVEMSYQKTKEYDRLSFLYLIAGNTEKLRKMLKIAELRGDVMSRFHNAMFLGDAEERVNVLEATGQLTLAYIAAVMHGLDEHKARLAELLEGANLSIPEVDTDNVSLLQPPTPIIRGDNWPLLAVTKAALDMSQAAASDAPSTTNYGNDEEEVGGAWGGDDDDLFDDEDDNKQSGGDQDIAIKGDPGAWADEDDLDLSDDEEPAAAKEKGSGDSFFSVPLGGTSPAVSWCAESTHAADHFSAGSAESGLSLLNRQIALTAAPQLRTAALSLVLGSTAFLPGLPLAPPTKSYLARDDGKNTNGKPMPLVAIKVDPLLNKLKNVYRTFTAGQFGDCETLLKEIMVAIPLVVANSRTETNDIKELLSVCREYMTAVRVKTAIGTAANDPVKSLELNAYFTHCNLQPAHLMLALKTAMAAAFKAKNFINATSFSRRLLELPDMGSERNADSRVKAQKVLTKSEQAGRNEHKIDYDEMNPFQLDCASFKPLYKGSPIIKCSYCASAYDPSYQGKLCVTCNLCAAGIETVGLVVQNSGSSRR
jgi:coatomer subunit alpha